MTIELDAVGRRGVPTEATWTSRDSMLYNLSIGFGQQQTEGLRYTTENSEGIELSVLPTFATSLAQRADRPSFGYFKPHEVVHGQQSVTWHGALPASGSATLVCAVDAIEDKGSGALVTLTTSAHDREGKPLFDARSGIFLRGHGGFAGSHTTKPPENPVASKAREVELAVTIRPEQALYFRLNQDRNPLHSDPTFARRAGFDRPILHGLCTYGSVVRVLTREFAGGDGDLLRAVTARFRQPVYPGSTLTVRARRESASEIRFTAEHDGATVLENGRIAIGTRTGVPDWANG
ncbi:MaoC/PaaZ C-terminal domain-containing protein [Salinibacterium sp. ZJ454]|uniref:MaoC/PaaZ C-terminal domain-containing protein n=1 Tax=Salinibacterium sp. ZJ454 TaxID=2708339 RepID=UPI00142093F1|nr:MaoC/PaaZ C-terminal domain-containing protein [Salinibacterium sp. ZJ454]